MKKHKNINKNELATLPAVQSSFRATVRSSLASSLSKVGCAAIALMAVASPVMAQFSVAMTPDKGRITVPINSTGTFTATITVTVANADGVLSSTLAPTGVPAGSAITLSQTVFTNSGTSTLTFNYTNLAQGQYDVAIEAAGDAANRLPLPLTTGYRWNSTAAAGNLTAPANWVGGVAPGATDTVIIPDVTFGSSTTPSILITNNVTIGVVRDIHNGNSTYPNWNIADGSTLSITGSGGFLHLRDELTSNSRAYLAASGAGTLLVSNATANFDLFAYAENTQNHFLFDGLNTLKLDVNRIAIDDIRAYYPNYRTNGTSTFPRRWSPRFYLAKTNVFRATLTDGNAWTNAGRDYSFVIARGLSGNGSGTDFAMRFGLQNEFYCDSMLWGGSGYQCDGNANSRIDFNTGLSGTRNLILRGPNGGRMANLTLGDAQAENGGTVSQSTKIVANLTDGIVDALIDTLYLGRDADTANGGQGTGRITFDEGTIDVNTAYLGYQTGPGNGTGVGYAQGIIDVQGTGVLRVNNALVLGYTSIAGGTPFGAEQGNGQVNISAGGTVLANSITVGGLTAASIANNITISGGGTLVVSNTAGSASARIQTLSMSDSTLTLFPDGGTSTPYVYVTNLVIGGTGNTLKLATVTGVSSYPATLALVSYTGSAAPNFSLDLPSGLYGYVLNNTGTSTIEAVITTNPPANRVWNGNVNGNWDTATANWQGGTSFANGDQATFDDTAAGTTSVSVVGTVIPGAGGVLVTNDTKAYSFAGGTLAGSAILTKEGSNTLTIGVISELALNINGGTVNGAGTLGATTVGSAGTLNYSGTINSLSSGGTASSSGTVNIGTSITGGTFDNAGTINGAYSVTGGSVTNRVGSTVNTVGVSTMATGATLVHNGQMNLGNANVNSRFSMAGNLTGSGTISDLTGDPAANNGRLEINGGGVFTPGGAGVIGNFTVEGRFDLNAATPDGMLVIDVDMNNAQTNDILYVDKWSNFRGALTMNNIGSIPFAAGQSFMIYSNNFGFPNTPEAAFDLTNKITPKVPGVGLQWNVNDLKLNGLVKVVAAPLAPPTLLSSNVGGTNLTFSWPASHIGYQLQVQTNSLSVGLNTNWVGIAGTEQVVSTNFPVDPANPSVFFRLSNQ